MNLHWLPVKARIEYKILTTTYKIISGCCPVYLKNLISFSKNIYDLRSSSYALLRQPKYRTRHYGDRAFSIAAPRVGADYDYNRNRL